MLDKINLKLCSSKSENVTKQIKQLNKTEKGVNIKFPPQIPPHCSTLQIYYR